MKKPRQQCEECAIRWSSGMLISQWALEYEGKAYLASFQLLLSKNKCTPGAAYNYRVMLLTF